MEYRLRPLPGGTKQSVRLVLSASDKPVVRPRPSSMWQLLLQQNPERKP